MLAYNTPLEVIEQRERQRANSPVGHARSHYKEVHDYSEYDLVLKDPSLTATELAQKIADFIHNNSNPKSFKYYQSKFKA